MAGRDRSRSLRAISSLMLVLQSERTKWSCRPCTPRVSRAQRVYTCDRPANGQLSCCTSNETLGDKTQRRPPIYAKPSFGCWRCAPVCAQLSGARRPVESFGLHSSLAVGGPAAFATSSLRTRAAWGGAAAAAEARNILPPLVDAVRRSEDRVGRFLRRPQLLLRHLCDAASKVKAAPYRRAWSGPSNSYSRTYSVWWLANGYMC